MKYEHNFDSIAQMVEFINNTERTYTFSKEHMSTDGTKYFTGTESFEEAMDYLLHGWEYMSQELTKRLKTTSTSSSTYKNVYSVQGFQASVPRYLQGMPDNMIHKKTVQKKVPVIKIYKNIGYTGNTTTEKIIEESVKVLRLVRNLENIGTRCELYICLGSYKNGTYTTTTLKIKPASQKLNMKQIAFPLVNPSMLRRIGLGLFERYPECNKKCFRGGYGYPIEMKEMFFDVKNQKNKNCYYFPSIIDEDEITDIEKYRVGA